MIVKFVDLESWRCEDIKGIVAAKIGKKSFGTFGKQVPGYDKGLILATSASLPFLRWKF